MNYLASPPLVVAYALVGTMDADVLAEPLGVDAEGRPVYVKDIWPTPEEIRTTIAAVLQSEMFRRTYAEIFRGEERSASIP
jgi:aconitate hydratase